MAPTRPEVRDTIQIRLALGVTFDGRRIPYAGPWEHAVTVVGVADDAVFVNNAITGQGWVSKSQFEAAYAI